MTERYSTTDIIKQLREKDLSLFSLSDFARLFNINNRSTLYKRIQRLEKEGIIQKLIKGKYLFLFNPTNDWAIANYLYQPSYVSLESALSFYGMITGFPYKITSLTSKKPRTFYANQKEFQYSQISQRFFWGYEKKENFLIAEKEKALLDYLYFSLKGLRSFDENEFELRELDQKKLRLYAKLFKDDRLLKIIKGKIL